MSCCEGTILTVKNLKTTFHVHRDDLRAVRGVDFHVDEGEFFALVGESGSGKSVLMKSVMGILPENAEVTADCMEFAGAELQSMSAEERRKLRGKEMAMIFQDPMTALNPVKKIGAHLTEVIRRYQNISKAEAREQAIEALRKVGIPSPESRMDQYPHEFSGGMRQRVMIAMALCCKPKLLIADEPTTALDVTIQAQILDLLKELKEKECMSIVLITHDLGVVASTCTRIAVMYSGMIMETGLAEDIIYHPKHPYTRALLRAVPKPISGSRERLEAIPGSAPSLLELPDGCPFRPRCAFACEKCGGQIPEMRVYSDTQSARCVFSAEELDEMERKNQTGEEA
ncbi:MAG: ABC transporter ATP-binding protein [Clostridiales bacterium]|nr:ABC transporter ATP-binding protein [Clostridiales bacterium]